MWLLFRQTRVAFFSIRFEIGWPVVLFYWNVYILSVVFYGAHVVLLEFRIVIIRLSSKHCSFAFAWFNPCGGTTSDTFSVHIFCTRDIIHYWRYNSLSNIGQNGGIHNCDILKFLVQCMHIFIIYQLWKQLELKICVIKNLTLIYIMNF